MNSKSMFFGSVESVDALKTKYKELCKKYHPDVGGDTATMQAINAVYGRLLRELKLKDGKDQEAINREMDIEEDLMKKIQEIVSVAGIEIEVCNLWIWVSGNTYSVRKELKDKGLRFAPKKELWFWRPDYAKKEWRSSPLPMEEIRKTYGSIKVETIERRKLEVQN